MRNFLVSSSAILLYLIAAYGWGRLARNRLYQDNRPGWAFTVVSGLGIWIFIGGILNAAHLAYPQALDAILGLGVGIAIAFAYPSLSKNRITSYYRELRMRLSSVSYFRGIIRPRLLPIAIIVFLFLFLVATQMPASAFNYHDDFQTYMPRLIRMLETGSLGGNPFDAIGVDSLGAQAFMQSFFMGHLSLSYINAFDLISCFVLCLLLLREVWLTQKNHWIFLLASLVTFVVINPMYVNISSLYSGSLMILGTVYSSLVFSDYMRSAEYKRLFAGILLVSLFLSALLSLKLTFVFFAATYFAVYYGLSLLFSENKSRMLLTASLAGLTAIIFITPWILVSLPNYLSAWHLTLTGQELPITGDRDGLFLSNISIVFSFKKSNWGGYYLGYSLIALLLGVMGLVSLIQLTKSRDKALLPRLITLSAACLAAVVSFIVNVHLFDPDTAVRYTIPVLIPVASVALTMPWIKRHTPQAHSQKKIKQLITANTPGITVFLAVVLISGCFSHELVDRISRAYQQRTQISFPINNGDLLYNEAALGKPAADWVYALQHKIEAGSTIFAMISVPFHLDYARNPVFFYSESGILNPWFAIPLNKHPEATRKYLSDSGIQYVMYEYRGGGMKQDRELQSYLGSPYWMFRDIGERSIKFRNILRYLTENSRLIYRDGQVVIFDINQRILLPSSIPLTPN
jgi:hypothetical protein